MVVLHILFLFQGQIWINGFNVGRYWPARGPQVTLFVPANILSTVLPNNVTVLELEGAPCTSGPCYMEFTASPILSRMFQFDFKESRRLFNKGDLLWKFTLCNTAQNQFAQLVDVPFCLWQAIFFGDWRWITLAQQWVIDIMFYELLSDLDTLWSWINVRYFTQFDRLSVSFSLHLITNLISKYQNVKMHALC